MIETASIFVTNPNPASTPLEYRRGWLIHPRENPDVPESWISMSIGPLSTLSIHPATRLTRYATSTADVILIGFPVDLAAGSVDTTAMAREIASTLSEQGPISEATLKHVAYLGGRFVCLISLAGSNELSILTDCTASHPVYWAQTAELGFVASQHASLCASVAGVPVDENSKALIKRARSMNTPGTLFPPGTLTGYKNVLQVLPNHILRVNAMKTSHDRFYPFSDTCLESNESRAYNTFKEAFIQHIGLLSTLGTIGVSLTGGRDSRATLAALLPHLTDESLTWTYFNSDNPHPVHVADLEAAKNLSASLGIRHREVDLKGPHRSEFAVAHQRTMGATAQMANIPLSYDSQLPSDLLEFQSMAAEVGTGFYRNRYGEPTADRLAELYSRSDFGQLPEVRNEIHKFIDYADFYPSSFGEMDFHDFFYWEHRLGRWGSRRIQEVDLAHNIVLPFNSRTVIESLMSAPSDSRGKKEDLIRFVRETSP